MCPSVFAGKQYALWADTQVRPYTNYINTTSPASRCCSTRSIIERRTQKDLAEVRRIIAVGRRGKAPNDPRTLDGS